MAVLNTVKAASLQVLTASDIVCAKVKRMLHRVFAFAGGVCSTEERSSAA